MNREDRFNTAPPFDKTSLAFDKTSLAFNETGLAFDKTNLVNRTSIALLDFYVAAGVDVLLDDEPHNRMGSPALAEPASFQPPLTDVQPIPLASLSALPSASPSALPSAFTLAKPSVAAQAGSSPALLPDEAAHSARKLVDGVSSLQELEQRLAQFNGCALKLTAKNMVFADGNPLARIMFVGEAPGSDEDRIGKPFVGRSGLLLDKMMAAIGLDRSNAYIANIIPWRPPGNRTPTPQEVMVCRPFIEKQIELCNPDVLVCLGGPSAQALLGIKDGILKARGRVLSYQTAKRPLHALATLHPAYLLRQPLQKRLAWRDFLSIKQLLQSPPLT